MQVENALADRGEVNGGVGDLATGSARGLDEESAAKLEEMQDVIDVSCCDRLAPHESCLYISAVWTRG